MVGQFFEVLLYCRLCAQIMGIIERYPVHPEHLIMMMYNKHYL